MAHIIFDLKNDRAVTKPHYGIRHFDNARGAKIALSALLRTNNRDADEYLVITREYFDAYLDPMVETTNLMSGKVVMIRRSEKGSCTDVGTERYWSM